MGGAGPCRVPELAGRPGVVGVDRAGRVGCTRRRLGCTLPCPGAHHEYQTHTLITLNALLVGAGRGAAGRGVAPGRPLALEASTPAPSPKIAACGARRFRLPSGASGARSSSITFSSPAVHSHPEKRASRIISPSCHTYPSCMTKSTQIR